MKLASLNELYVQELLQDLYSAEKMILKALPKMTKAASSSELQQALQDYLEQTKMHVERLDQVFEKLSESPKGKKCKGVEGLLEGARRSSNRTASPT